MSQLKKVLFKLTLVNSGRNNAFVKKAVKEYKLKKGYNEMAFINLSLAEMSLESDNESLSKCEEKLTECE